MLNKLRRLCDVKKDIEQARYVNRFLSEIDEDYASAIDTKLVGVITILDQMIVDVSVSLGVLMTGDGLAMEKQHQRRACRYQRTQNPA